MSSLPTKSKQVQKIKGVKPPKDSKKAKEFYKHHSVHSGPHITGQGAEHATYDFDDDDYEVQGGLQKRKDKQKRGYEPVESVNEKMGPKQFHSYMQYVFDTQFKTPAEKKMKKAMIKKINIHHKRQGLPLFKESVNEKTVSIGGKELLKFLMKRFKMSKSQAIASMKKHKMDMSFLKKESVNEAVEPKGNMAKVAKIVRSKQAAKLGGVMIDMQSANLLMKLWDAVSDKDKEKMNKLNPKVLTTVIKKLWSRVNLKLPI